MDLPIETQSEPGEQAAASARLPPTMVDAKQHTADDVLTMLNKMPLFMTELDETDERGNENTALEAIKAMAYEGSRAEQAENFRQQGNEHARVRNWSDAREFYTRAIVVLKAPPKSLEDRIEEMPDMEVVEIDEEAEARREKEIEEASYTNRALSLDKVAEALDACNRGLGVEANNSALKLLLSKIQEREKHLVKLSKQRQEREEREKAEDRTLKLALKARNIPMKNTGKAPDMEDAKPKLKNPLDASSTLSIPAILLYPFHLQTDFIKEFSEHISLQEQLSYILPLPWDEKNEYTLESVDCYMETTSGGLIKVGKKVRITKTLTSGKVEVIDNMLKIYVVLRARAQEWIDDFKKKRGAAS
ncbi:MAG: hypothetical protein M1821_004521 [Bathelium mastoideum]|nr:MAG: hypothetical protein M1821_004521 [Bathelium mastoideum]